MQYELSLHGGTRTDISCRQFDQGATFTLSVLESLTGKLIRLETATPDGGVLETIGDLAEDGHTVTFPLDRNLTYKCGTYLANIVIYDSGLTNRTSYPLLRIRVEKTANQDVEKPATVAPSAIAYLQEKQTATDTLATVNKSRIDTLVNSGSEGGTSDTELQDIRVDCTGKTHSTAGEAVRAVEKRAATLEKNSMINLAAADKLIRVVANGGTLTESGADLVFTSTTSYGYAEFDVPNLPNAGTQRTYAVMIKTKTVLDAGAYLLMYAMTMTGQNLAASDVLISVPLEGGKGIFGIIQLKSSQVTSDRAYLGIVTPNGTSYTLDKSSAVMVDITGFLYKYFTSAQWIDFLEKVQGGNPPASLAVFSGHAAISDKSTVASSLIFPSVEDFQFSEIAKTVSSWQPDGSVKSLGGINYTFETSIVWGAIQIKREYDLLFQTDKKYLVIYSGEPFHFIGLGQIVIGGGGWTNPEESEVTFGDTAYRYGTLYPGPEANNDALYIRTNHATSKPEPFSIVGVYELDKEKAITESDVKKLIMSRQLAPILEKNFINPEEEKSAPKVLAIGDSITAARRWTTELAAHGYTVSVHAKGGVGMIQMVDGDKGLGGNYDNETEASGTLFPLSVADVQDKDFIVFLGGYNNRDLPSGEVTDLYPAQNTIAGMTRYCLNRIYEMLVQAGNLTCKILLVTPHCFGKYPYADADGYEEWPAGSGQTMEKLVAAQKKVAASMAVPVCDLYHEAGFNRYTWSVFGNQPNPVNADFTRYELDASGAQVGTTPLCYVKGQSYYQQTDTGVQLVEYTGSAPYPYNGDQLHCSDAGYKRIGVCVAGALKRFYD